MQVDLTHEGGRRGSAAATWALFVLAACSDGGGAARDSGAGDAAGTSDDADAASDADADAASDVDPGEDMADQPAAANYGCWQTTAWSEYTTDDFAKKYITGTGTFGFRTQYVKEREGHEHSIESATSAYGGPLEASAYQLEFWCNNDADPEWDHHHLTTWRSSYPDAGDDGDYSGCVFPGVMMYARIRVRTAACNR